jgi:hypothetical protein
MTARPIRELGGTAYGFDYTDYSATTPACQHANGWYVTVKFWIFSKHVFVCSDCGHCATPTKEPT